jgi:hypothetical protein
LYVGNKIKKTKNKKKKKKKRDFELGIWRRKIAKAIAQV